MHTRLSTSIPGMYSKGLTGIIKSFPDFPPKIGNFLEPLLYNDLRDFFKNSLKLETLHSAHPLKMEKFQNGQSGSLFDIYDLSKRLLRNTLTGLFKCSHRFFGDSNPNSRTFQGNSPTEPGLHLKSPLKPLLYIVDLILTTVLTENTPRQMAKPLLRNTLTGLFKCKPGLREQKPGKIGDAFKNSSQTVAMLAGNSIVRECTNAMGYFFNIYIVYILKYIYYIYIKPWDGEEIRGNLKQKTKTKEVSKVSTRFESDPDKFVDISSQPSKTKYSEFLEKGLSKDKNLFDYRHIAILLEIFRDLDYEVTGDADYEFYDKMINKFIEALQKDNEEFPLEDFKEKLEEKTKWQS